MAETVPHARRASRRRRLVRIGLALGVLLLLAGGTLLAVTVEPLRAWVFSHVGQDCGTITQDLGGPLTDVATAQDAERCFLRASTQCRAAALSYVRPFLDGRTTHTFVVEPAIGFLHGCSLADAYGTQLEGGGYSGRTAGCAGVVRDAEGLRFLACGPLGDMRVPS